jgi:hypothetical protein
MPAFNEEELVEIVLSITSGRLGKQQLIETFESNCGLNPGSELP